VWRAGALEALGREGRNYRVAYMSAHTAGQRAAIMADLAVAPLPRSFLGSDMIELTPKDGMPEIGTYSLAMVVAPEASAPVKAVAEHIRATFEVFRETGKF
jgi:DNA-binding transcriptional LysR family regulator